MTSCPALRELAEKEDSALVERLLGRAQWYEEARPFYVKTPALLREAASEIGSLLDKYDAALAEIDRLREALTWAMNQVPPYTRRIEGQNEKWCDAYDKASQALRSTP